MTDCVIALDIGTTTLKCQIIDSSGEVIVTTRSLVKLLYPQPGWVEIDPNELWDEILKIIRQTISDSKVPTENIKSIGISTQRASFVTWEIDTGKPLHNFITWKDLRTRDFTQKLNASLKIKSLRFLSYMIYLLSFNQRFLAGSKLEISPNQLISKLLWALENIPKIKDGVNKKNILFGTVDSWIIYRLTGGKTHVTDITNAAGTAFFDPFILDWGDWAINLLGIPKSILPQIVPNDHDFGMIDSGLFGKEIPIKCVMGDQSSAMFAAGCFEKNDLKLTIGTGGFLNVNTANNIPVTVMGTYPLVAWKMGNELKYMGETACYDCGSLIEWLLNSGFIKTASEIDLIVDQVTDTDGVYFISAFSGLGPPINVMDAATGFIGIKPTTNRNHMVRAVVESIAYRIALSYQMVREDTNLQFTTLTIDGGVSQSNFICQLLADLMEISIKRFNSCEMSLWGVGFGAGLSMGIWKNLEDLKKLQKIDRIFKPTTNENYAKKCKIHLNKWMESCQRFKSWLN